MPTGISHGFVLLLSNRHVSRCIKLCVVSDCRRRLCHLPLARHLRRLTGPSVCVLCSRAMSSYLSPPPRVTCVRLCQPRIHLLPSRSCDISPLASPRKSWRSGSAFQTVSKTTRTSRFPPPDAALHAHPAVLHFLVAAVGRTARLADRRVDVPGGPVRRRQGADGGACVVRRVPPSSVPEHPNDDVCGSLGAPP